MTLSGERVVTVFGASDPSQGSQQYQIARAVGRKLAEMGYAVANGGYGGTMTASARGAKEAGGKTIGVTCSIWPTKPNRYIDTVVVTDSHWQRVHRLIELGKCGYVVLPGATGTLVELATVWELMCKGLLDRRPLVCVGGFWRPLIERMASAGAGITDFVAVVPCADDLDAVFAGSGSTAVS